MKRTFLAILCLLYGTSVSCGASGASGASGGTGNGANTEAAATARRYLARAMELMDTVSDTYFEGEEMLLSEYYNPFTGSLTGTGGSDASIWKYTSALEAAVAILHALAADREHGAGELYDANFDRYRNLVAALYRNADYYKGTYTLTSYAGTREWSVYAVPRGAAPGAANPGGDSDKFNVYDDQMWFIRELLEAYKVTGDDEYLFEAEYLTEYVLDGWDCTLAADGTENGGITWGPGYVTKHSCSNGPMVSPLVWLHELYKGREETMTYGYIAADGRRLTRTVRKSDGYLDFARRIYEWQKRNLMRPDGLFHDMLGGCGQEGCTRRYEWVGGKRFRTHTQLSTASGAPLTYNSGAMLSGASDLYRATGDERYMRDMERQSTASFDYFARPDTAVPGYRSWQLSSTWSGWFNGVLMRAAVDAWRASCEQAIPMIESFRENLDYGWEHHLYRGFLPDDLTGGWNDAKAENRVNVMSMCSAAAQYAVLSRRELEKSKP